MEQIVYEDNPHLDIWMKLILALPVLIIIVSGIAVIAFEPRESAYEACGTLALSLVLVLMFFFNIVPRAYVVCDNGIVIRTHGFFTFNIPFSTVNTVRGPQGINFSINLPTNLSQSSVLVIDRKRRLPITITPADRQSFLSNFDKAFKEWQQYGGK